MPFSAPITRRGLIIGGASALGLAACGSFHPPTIAPEPVSPNRSHLYSLMRKTGVRAFC